MADISGVNNSGVYNTPTMVSSNNSSSSSNNSSGLNSATNNSSSNSSSAGAEEGLNAPVNNSGSGGSTNSNNNTNNSSSANNSGSGTNNSNNTTTDEVKSPTDNPSHATKPKDDNNTLDKDAFLRLFLEQLKAQDPTSPMETNQILEQSAMMTQIEMQQQMKETLESMTEAIESMAKSAESLAKFQTNMGDVLGDLGTAIDENSEITALLAQLNAYNSSGVLGKIAETQYTGIELSAEQVGKRQTFELYFDEPINLDKDNGGNELAKVVIKDSDGATVKTIQLANYRDPETGAAVDLNGKKGYIVFEWDAKDQSSNNVKAGGYSISAEYNYESDGKTAKTTKIGRGEVMGVAFQNGIPFIKLGTTDSNNNHFQMLGATQFYAKPA